MPTRPTPELTAQVAAFVRAGAFPHVAAAAAGVGAAVHDDWMRRAEGKRAARSFKGYRAAVLLAAAQARAAAELAVHQDKPELWLTKGPGKEKGNSPGWSGVVKPLLTVDNRSVNLLADPGAAALIQVLLAALVPFPEARRAVLAALNGTAAAADEPKRLTLDAGPQSGG